MPLTTQPLTYAKELTIQPITIHPSLSGIKATNAKEPKEGKDAASAPKDAGDEEGAGAGAEEGADAGADAGAEEGTDAGV